ncbi:TraY domain-containing protein [Yersinia mollaretii]|uniref:TraY domain-containing protein n=2 Tax=Yersinia TaxID=629 RepID=UPI000C15D867|nr:TraY domain-containing protein [Yersinia mollaretii]MDA5525600.1 TraY domain-containing protein [Yersinia mollaretii]MDR7875675.1 TraY domain-containing protein [Yersinia mollaretii]PHZ29880.1 hypothetical protein CS537_20140 [Yersinia mollaretii]WQC73747.1 TraY domain-containing protein [Yersinia mollaretii]
MSRIAPYPLRMPPEMRSFLEEQSDKSMRSLQQEVLFRLDKFQQIENLLASSSEGEDMYMQVANALRMVKVAEDRAKEIERLKQRQAELMATLNLSETDRFMRISQNAEIIEKAIANITNALPIDFLPKKENEEKDKKS